jgi:phosphoribosyl-ATP pyrophosphohydrolase
VAGADGFLKAASKKRAAKKGEPGLNAAFPKNALKEFEVLPALAALIARRRRELREGSYTTHLFKSGAGKIRKKTGEEAVELILAQGKSEIICEAADLVYHLLVLLEAEGVGLGEVLGELKGRG